NGLGLDDERITRLINSSNNHKAPTIPVGKKALGDKQPIYVEKSKHDDHWHAAGPDPHIWLGMDEAVTIVQLISQALQEKDAAHKSDYQTRADAYIAEIKKLRGEGEKQLKGKKGILITTHDSVRYFARSFGLSIAGNIQVQPGIEGDADKLKTL